MIKKMLDKYEQEENLENSNMKDQMQKNEYEKFEKTYDLIQEL